MAYVDWSIKGPQLSVCNCDWGCPCQFNALPTHGDCRAAVAMRIDQGHFGQVKLDGVVWVSIIVWPGAIHEGGGEALPIVDERATQAQRDAVMTILAGKETEPGATIFNVFAGTIAKGHKPLFKPIAFEIDIANRTGRFSVPGVIEARGEPIRNPVTGQPHRVRVGMPHGFEYSEAEFASGSAKATAPIPLDYSKRHAHFAMIHMTPYGPVR